LDVARHGRPERELDALLPGFHAEPVVTHARWSSPSRPRAGTRLGDRISEGQARTAPAVAFTRRAGLGRAQARRPGAVRRSGHRPGLAAVDELLATVGGRSRRSGDACSSVPAPVAGVRHGPVGERLRSAFPGLDGRWGDYTIVVAAARSCHVMGQAIVSDGERGSTERHPLSGRDRGRSCARLCGFYPAVFIRRIRLRSRPLARSGQSQIQPPLALAA